MALLARDLKRSWAKGARNQKGHGMRSTQTDYPELGLELQPVAVAGGEVREAQREVTGAELDALGQY